MKCDVKCDVMQCNVTSPSPPTVSGGLRRDGVLGDDVTCDCVKCDV